MGTWRIAIGGCSPLPAGVGTDGRWTPPGVEGVDVLFVHGRDEAAGDWLAARPGASLAAELARSGWDRVDCYVADIAEYRPLALDAHEVADRIALCVGDWNVAGQLLWGAVGLVDAVMCDHAGVEHVERIGHRAVPSLIWGVREEWGYVDPGAERDIDVLFIGSTNPAIHARRNAWLARLGRMAARHHVVIRSRLFGPEYAWHFARAKLVFNHSVRGEANIRSYEGPVYGACVLNERGNPELGLVARADVDFATYDEHDLERVIDELLADDARRLAIARAGQAAVREHTITAHLARRVGALRDQLAASPPVERDGAAWAHFVERQWQLGISSRAHARFGSAASGADWTAARTILEHDLVRATSPEAAAEILASDVQARTPAAGFLRGRQLLEAGDATAAIAELERVVEQTPLDAAGHVALARARAAAGRTDEAIAGLESIAASLAAMPDLAAERAAANAALGELEASVGIAWLVVEPHDRAAIVAALRERVADPAALALLRIACLEADDGGPRLTDAVLAAIAELGIDPDELPDTEVYGVVAAERALASGRSPTVAPGSGEGGI